MAGFLLGNYAYASYINTFLLAQTQIHGISQRSWIAVGNFFPNPRAFFRQMHVVRECILRPIECHLKVLSIYLNVDERFEGENLPCSY